MWARVRSPVDGGAVKTHDEWGDQLPSGATLRDLYPYDAEDESSDDDDD